VPERATVYAMTHRLWSSAGGLLTAALIAMTFSPELQGFYYTFSSLLSFQTFVELGFGDILQQFVSHEWALSSSKDDSERRRAEGRLSSLLRLSLGWYGRVALLLLAGLGVGGSLYFDRFTPDATAPRWMLAWWLATLATAAGVFLTPFISFLEGANRVDRVYGTRLAQGVSSRLVGFAFIVSGAGLFTIAASRAASLAAGAVGTAPEGRRLLRRFWSARAPEGARVSFREELLPLQWRYALTWISGYVVTSLFTPVLFASRGPEVAGRMGMTVTAAAAISSAAFAATATKVPRLALHAARREFDSMDALFRRATLSSLALAGAGALALWLGLLFARTLDLPIAARFLPPFEVALFLLAVVLQQLRFAMGSYLRAHKAEPFVYLAACEGVAAVVVLTLLGRSYGSLGMVSGFLGLTLLTLLPVIAIFERSRTLWHRRTLEATA
jgi:hypothetical protein